MIKRNLLTTIVFMICFFASVAVLPQTETLKNNLPQLVIQTGHSSGVRNIWLSEDETRMISLSDDRLIFWDATAQRSIGEATNISAFYVTKDGKTAIIEGGDLLEIREIKSARQIFSIDKYWDWELDANHMQIVTRHEDKIIRLWKLSSGEKTEIRLPDFDSISGIVFGNDGKFLFVGVDETNSRTDFSKTGKIFAVNTATGEAKAILTDVSRWAMSGDAKNIIFSGADESVSNVFTIGENPLDAPKLTFKLNGLKGEWDLSPNQKYLVCKIGDELGIWEISTGIKKFSNKYADIQFSGNEKIISFLEGDQVKFFDLEKGEFLPALQNFEGYDPYNSDFHHELLAFETKNGLIVRNILDGKTIYSKSFTAGEKIYSLSISADEKMLATVVLDGNKFQLRVFDLPSGKEKLSSSYRSQYVNVDGLGQTPPIRMMIANRFGMSFVGSQKKYAAKINESFFFTKDNKTLICAEAFGEISVWNIAKAQKTRIFQAVTSALNAKFSTDSKTLEIFSDTGDYRTWDVKTGNFVFAKTIKQPKIEEKFLLDFDAQENCFLKDAKTQKLIFKTENCTSIEVSNDDKSVVFTKSQKIDEENYNNSLEVWSIAPKRLLFTQIKNADYYPDSFQDSTFDSTGKYLIFTRRTGKYENESIKYEAEVWNVAFGKKIFSAPVEEGKKWTISPDGKMLAIIGSQDYSENKFPFQVRRMADGVKLFEKPITDENHEIETAQFSADSSKIFLKAESDLSILDTKTFSLEKHCSYCSLLGNVFGYSAESFDLQFSPNGKMVVAYSNSKQNKIVVWNTNSFENRFKKILETAREKLEYGEISEREDENIFSLTGHSGAITNFSFSRDERFLITSSEDGTIKIWKTDDGSLILTLILLGETDWVVVDGEGRFDASPGAGKFIDLRVGESLISLEQLKERYYEPNLWQKLLGESSEPLSDVPDFSNILLPPEVEDITTADAKTNSTIRTVKIKNKGGGIGRVVVKVDGREFIEDARDETLRKNPNTNEYILSFDLRDAPAIEGNVQVIAWNFDKNANEEYKGYISSRGTAVYRLNVEKLDPPTLYAIIGGVSDYKGDALDLRFAAKDAEDIYNAMEIGGKNLFGAEKMKLKLFSTNKKNPKAKAPTKENFQKAFEEFAREAKPNDILFVYFSGHGITLGKNEDASNRSIYYYLTESATTTSREILSTDSVLLASTTISSEELTAWHKSVKARKQVLILDTCAAGAVGEGFVITNKEGISGDAKKALERMKDRVGFHVLMGSSANAVSYEASQYGQGLLTYSLLQGMRGAALKPDGQIDISKLFNYAADTVPDLAQNIGGIQKPEIRIPEGGASFSIGLISSESDKNLINLASIKPTILRPSFVNRSQTVSYDNLQITPLLQGKLQNAGFTSEVVFVDADEMPGAIKPVGTYTAVGGNVSIFINLIRDGKPWKTFSVNGSETDKTKLIDEIFNQIVALSKSSTGVQK